MSSRTRDYADRHPRNKSPRKAARAVARKAPARGSGGGGSSGLPAWAWMVVGLSAGLVVAAFVYVGRPAQPMDMAPSTADKSKPTTIELPPKEPSRFAFYEMLPSYEVVVSDEVLNAPPPKPASRPVVPPPDPATVAAVPRPEAIASAEPAVAALATGPQASPAERVAALQAAVAEEEQRRAAKSAASAAPDKKPPPPAAGVPAASGERYLIQVAAYRSRSDADQQRAALALAGLSAKVEQVTIDQRDTWYRVRLGPYTSSAAAEAAQRSLQSQGLKGVVMKVKS